MLLYKYIIILLYYYIIIVRPQPWPGPEPHARPRAVRPRPARPPARGDADCPGRVSQAHGWERRGEDERGPCASMTRTNREVYTIYCTCRLAIDLSLRRPRGELEALEFVHP